MAAKEFSSPFLAAARIRGKSSVTVIGTGRDDLAFCTAFPITRLLRRPGRQWRRLQTPQFLDNTTIRRESIVSAMFLLGPFRAQHTGRDCRDVRGRSRNSVAIQR